MPHRHRPLRGRELKPSRWNEAAEFAFEQSGEGDRCAVL
jgi:hypothetical protein